MIDAGLADKILADDFMSNVKSSVVGLLSAEEMDMLTDRMVQLREHVQELKDTGMTVSDWNSVQADNGRGLPRIFSKDARHSYVQALVKFTALAPFPVYIDMPRVKQRRPDKTQPGLNVLPQPALAGYMSSRDPATVHAGR